ncbi:MAG: 4'-phosphopantetheinyl transferase superfamily protein [Steroidobacteraceae bacterium]
MIDLWLGSPAAEQWFDAGKLSTAERDRYDGLKGEHRRREFAVSRALRHAALGNSSGDSSAPSSLSHSGGWAAVARGAPGYRVGVDLEFHRPRNLLGIARFAFDPAEIAMLEGLQPAQQPAVFYALWTLKESMAKALGLQLLEASRQCVFVSGNPADADAWRGTAPTHEPWMVRVFRPRPDMALCVTVIGSNDAESIATCEWPSDSLNGRRGEWQSTVTVRGEEA